MKNFVLTLKKRYNMSYNKTPELYQNSDASITTKPHGGLAMNDKFNTIFPAKFNKKPGIKTAEIFQRSCLFYYAGIKRLSIIS